MDSNGAKPPQDPKDVPSTIQEMMERMCCSGDFGPADMCRRMMSAMERRKGAEGQAAPGGTPGEEQPAQAEREASGGCCGPRPRCEPKGP